MPTFENTYHYLLYFIARMAIVSHFTICIIDFFIAVKDLLLIINIIVF